MDKQFSRLSGSISYTVFASVLFYSASIQSKSFEDALTLYRQGNFEKSYNELRDLSQNDNPQAYYLMGKMHERGDGVPHDDAKAIRFYNSAAELGMEDALERVEQLENSENSVVLDWYLESARDGDLESQYNMGYLYENGMGVRINERLALQWYEEAANQHHVDAEFRLALMLIAGTHIGGSDLISGKRWMELAADEGNLVAKEIEVLLENDIDIIDIVQIVRGLRTLENSAPETMLTVLASSVAAAKFAYEQLQSKKKVVTRKVVQTAEIIKEKPPIIIESEPVITLIEDPVGSLDSTQTIALETPVNSIALLDPPLKNEILALEMINWPTEIQNVPVKKDNQALWFMFWVLATFTSLLLLRFFVQNRFFISKSHFTLPKPDTLNKFFNWNEKSQLKIPSLNSDTDEALDVRDFWETTKQNSQPIHFPDTSELITETSEIITETPNSNLQQPIIKPEVLATAVVKLEETIEPITAPQTNTPKPEKLKFKPFEYNRKTISKSSVKAGFRHVLPENSDKISFDKIIPKHAKDIQALEQKKISDNYLKDIRKSLANTKFITNKIAQQTQLTRERKSFNMYFKEQTREFEAAKSNDSDTLSEARLNIGSMFFRGEGVGKNIKLAIKWLERAIDLGNQQAVLELQQLYVENPEYRINHDLSVG